MYLPLSSSSPEPEMSKIFSKHLRDKCMSVLTFSIWNFSLIGTQIRGGKMAASGLRLACSCVLFGLNIVFKIFGSCVNI